MEAIAVIATGMGVAWASGVNLYATVAVLGIMGATGSMVLPPELQVLQSDGIILAALVMFFIEFFADKVPGLDSGWDAVHTFIRIPAGAILAAQAVGEVSQEAQIVAFLLGGAVAGSAHATKAGARLVINTSPEPFSNWAASVIEDVAAVTALWVAFNHPWVMAGFVAAFFLFALWFVPRVWRLLKGALRKVAGGFGEGSRATPPPVG
ncbi:MAG: DUF4126 domain-containing protein [Nitrospinae bacterium]|nr:DUF4126 domain-containing protein [Nitrospinota bacterium]